MRLVDHKHDSLSALVEEQELLVELLNQNLAVARGRLKIQLRQDLLQNLNGRQDRVNDQDNSVVNRVQEVQ